ncbi:MAG: phytoene desaturase family protein [Hyphomicrobiales bacterium]|nr:phytoene desaturase family protein [Hyphomicrobiales bacterium]
MAGLAAAIRMAARGEPVTLLEKQAYPGGKMRALQVAGASIDAGPTVFTMKWVFDRLFGESGSAFDEAVGHSQAETLARHAWDDRGIFDLFADRQRSEAEIGDFFDAQNAAGYRRFCADAQSIFETLQDTFMAAPRPNPLQLAQRVGMHRLPTLLNLRPFSTLWRALGDYFPDPRLRQLFGRYATYVGSSPFQAPATLMLIAHVEQEGVWYIDGGMHALAVAMRDRATSLGVEFLTDTEADGIVVEGDSAVGVRLKSGEEIRGKSVLYCGDISRLDPSYFSSRKSPTQRVKPQQRALSAITWNVVAETSNFALHRHNVFFSGDYPAEFDAIFRHRQVPADPTVYVCAQNRDDRAELIEGDKDHMLCLINAPADGDTHRWTDADLVDFQAVTYERMRKCGLSLETTDQAFVATQPADFESLFPGSGGALYGRASHGWMASFQRPGAKTALPSFYLAGGSTHPGAGVPMATLSGMIAAEQILADR